MIFKPVHLSSLLLLLVTSAASQNSVSFTYNGFRSVDLNIDGVAGYTSNGLLMLTNTTKLSTGHAFYPLSINFKNSSSNSSAAFSFSTTFVFAVISEYGATLSGHGLAFTISPTRGLPGALPTQYLGLFNSTNNGDENNHVFAVELDTIESADFNDVDDNHVGIDVNSLESLNSTSAGYYESADGKFKGINLISGQPIQVWVEYDGSEKRIDVTLAPIDVTKPRKPLLSFSYDLSPILEEFMYVGFSSSTGSFSTSHYVLGWSFAMNGNEAKALNISQLPELPGIGGKETSKFLTIGLPVICAALFLALILCAIYIVRKKRKFVELVDEWELEYAPHRFKYQDLYIATKGFKDKELLGRGGFGKVYKGELPSSKMQIAVKRVSHDSKQGMREFVAEIVSIGRMRHRNLVTLLGYCRREGELLLVYDYMPNGSLDKYLYDQPKVTLNWSQRFRVIKGVASALLYLHEQWEKVVVHRDVKASNVLIDGELNGRLGDFGLARLYDHGTLPQTTHVVGTLGYLAPEHSRTGKATTSTDVYAFGAFLLEVACGKRPIESRAYDLVLVDWVFTYWTSGAILEAKDANMGTDYVAEEVELVLKLGLMCSVSDPTDRPSMRQMVQYLEKDALVPDISSLGTSANGLSYARIGGYDDVAMSNSSSIERAGSGASSIAESLLSGGR